MNLGQCIDKLINAHGSLRALARSAGIDAGYLSRLRSEVKDHPSDRILEALGIERVVTYKLSRKPQRPMPGMSAADAAAYHGLEE